MRAVAVEVAGPAFDELLLAAIGDAPIVLLGESHHGVHETYELRSRVLATLGRRGWRTLATEIAHADGIHLDRFLSDGDASHLDRVGTFGHRTPSTRPPEGVLAAQISAAPLDGYRVEIVRVLDELRAAGAEGERWHHVGVDVDYDPTLAEALLEVDGPDAHPGVAATLELSRRYDAEVRAAATFDDLRAPMALRERVMALHALDAIDAAPGRRIVVCGHAFHITPAPPGGHIGGTELRDGIGPGGGIAPPLGAAIAARHRGAVACIWLLHDHGRDLGGAADGVVRSVPGSLNAALADVGRDVAVRTADVPELSEPWAIATVHGATLQGVPAELCDVLVFVATTTELHTR